VDGATNRLDISIGKEEWKALLLASGLLFLKITG